MIAIAKVDHQLLEETIADLISKTGFTPDKGRGIFLKPNVVIGTGDFSIITSSAVVEGLIRYFSGCKIIIGERSAVGVDTMLALERAGYLTLAKRYGVEVVDLNSVDRVEVEWERGILKLPRLLFDHHYINVAALKTHFLTTVSLCAKNQKGLLTVKDAKKFHFIGIHQAIAALGKAVKPDLNVVDGIQGLEGNGPTSFGRAKKTDLLIAGDDLFLVDSVACTIMGIKPREVAHLVAKDIPQCVMSQIELCTSSFKKPDLENDLRVGNLHIHNIRNCCSGCIFAIDSGFNWLMTERKDLWEVLQKKLSVYSYHIYLGTGKHLNCEGALPHLRAFGSCSAHFARQHQLPYIKGCPPLPQDIISLFQLDQ